jgi:hypothetical protein
MMASTQQELVAMNRIATAFATKHRFQFNGDKSGVMVFNVSVTTRKRAEAEAWVLFGEPVKVKSEYVYLGTVTNTTHNDWGGHLRAVIARAKKRSVDLL